jgi:hypothetical protein
MPLLSAICEDTETGAILAILKSLEGLELGEPTVKIKDGLAIPDRVAVMLVVPFATADTKPPADIVAMAVLELDQLTCEVTAEYAVSEYVPTATNCSLEPILIVAG